MNHLHGSMSGHTAWEVLDEHGEVLESGEHHNLILNTGLDAFAGETGGGYGYSNPGESPEFVSWRHYLALGTGSAAPDVTQTLLENEVARTGSTGNFPSNQYTITRVGDDVVGVFPIVRALTFGAAANLTEYGFSAVANPRTVLSIRELFRDAQGNPVVLTVQPGQTLKVTHTFTYRVKYAREASAFTVDGVGPLNGSKGFYFYDDTLLRDVLLTCAPGAGLYGFALRAADTGGDGLPPLYRDGDNNNARAGVGALGYVSGSAERVKRATFPASGFNGPHFGWVFSSHYFGNAGFRWSSGAAPALTKSDTQELTIDFRLSWGRA